MSTHNQNENSTKEANAKMRERFKDFSARVTTEATSEAEKANQEIQEEFYGSAEQNNSLPFHVDVNNPPIKK